MKKLSILLFMLLCLSIQTCFAMEKVFYVLRGDSISDATAESAWTSAVKNNSKSINIIISQAFQVDALGTVWGSVNQPISKIARQNNIHFMGLLTNENFDSDEVDRFLKSRATQTKAINSVLSLCQKYHLYGIQVDFEGVPSRDRNLFAEFYNRLSETLHQHGFKISAALYPETTNTPATAVLKREYNNQEGAYDFASIGKASDFVTIMTYNQSTTGTTPGPVAGTPWMKKVIQYTLRYIPADKVSLGIPSYSNYWSMEDHNGHNRVVETDISWNTVLALLSENHQFLKWDQDQQVPYAFYFKNQFGEYIFAEDAQSFRDKLNLIHEFHLRGFSFWRLGMEDPAIWHVLKIPGY